MVVYIYSILVPILAAVFTVSAFQYKENVLPSFLSGFLWFASAYTTLHIKFISPGTVPYYWEDGTGDITMLFNALGVIMIVYGVILTLKISQQIKTGDGTEEEG